MIAGEARYCIGRLKPAGIGPSLQVSERSTATFLKNVGFEHADAHERCSA